MNKLVVGDRVLWPGYDFGGGTKHPDRLGHITNVYNGAMTVSGCTEFIEVTFDDGKVERGFLQGGMLQRVDKTLIKL